MERADGKVAEIVEWGTDKDVYHGGDRPVAFIEIRNTGARAINDATVKLTVSRKTSLGSIALLRDQMHKVSEFVPGFNVPPGKSKRFEVSPFQIPDIGMAKGTYELKAEIVVDSRSIGTISKTIKVK
jgi:hypothetical protein